MKRPAILLLTLSASTLTAGTLNLNPVQDNTIYETNSEPLSNGAGQYLFTGRTGQNADERVRRAIIKFDLSTVPAGATINSASLTLTVSRTISNSTINLHRTTSDWGEGDSDAGGEEGQGTLASFGDATWISAFNGDEQNGGISWNTVGGDFVGSASANTNVSGLGNVTFSGPNLIADIENWLDGTHPNHGWFVIGNEAATNTAVRFNSRENASNQPVLVLDVTIPDLIFSDDFE